jgi:hypothetical protein
MVPRALAVACVAAALLSPADVDAQSSGWPVLITGMGPKTIRIEVAAGKTLPCDSSRNIPLWSGKLEPGAALSFSSPYPDICFRQTFDNFPDVNWSTPHVYSAVMYCTRPGACVVAPDPTIRLSVVSSETK